MTYTFRAERLDVGYDQKPVVRNVSFSVEAGQMLTLIGPNGSGKTTLLKSIACQLEALGGSVMLDGQELTRLKGDLRAKQLALMTPVTTQTQWMTCYDVAAAGRYPYTGKLGILSQQDREIIWDALKRVHAEALADRDFNCISDGQRQRILLARAIAQQPKLLLLDEPTSFLDIRSKVELLTILKELTIEQKITVIMSLHELELAQKASDLVACVEQGRIGRFGTPEAVFQGDYITRLYEMKQGHYDPVLGGVELPLSEGIPQVFVIGGGGTGIPIYRLLQRRNIPFAAGILHENDLDYPVASALASRIVVQQAYTEMTEDNYRTALNQLKQCRCVLCPQTRFGTINDYNRQLRQKAAELGLLREAQDV